MFHCDDLVLVRQRSATGQRGRRGSRHCKPRDCGDSHRQLAGRRQDMTRFLIDRSRPQPTETELRRRAAHRGQVLGALNNSFTPNAENARQLLPSVGFDLRPYWTWTNGALGRREVTSKPADLEQDCGIGSGCDMPHRTATKSCRRPACSARGRCGSFRDHRPDQRPH
jgi:hypothetical protein